MKKAHFILTMLFFIVCFNACKKANDNHTETPEYVAPSHPGIIVLSQTSYTIYPDTGVGSHNYQVSLTAKLYDSNGQLDAVQPTFSFESSNTDVATVDNAGSIKGLKVGTAAIGVTDNVHGVSYAIVSVLPYDSSLSLSALSIVFNAPVLDLPVGTSQNASYQLFDGTGNIVSTPVTLSSNTSTGIAISGNSIQASASGIYTITAFNSSQQQLSGALVVHAYVPQTGSGGWHWDASVDGKKIVRSIGLQVVPKRFLRPGLTAKPIVVNVYEEDYTIPPSAGHIAPGFNVYEASPDAINFGNDVLTLSNGRVQSNKGGVTAIYATYKGVKSDPLHVWVHSDFRGKYVITVNNSNPGDYPTTLNMGYYYNDDVGRSKDIDYYCDHCGGGAPDQYTGIRLTFSGCNQNTGNEDAGGSIFIQEAIGLNGPLTETSGITYDGVWLGNLYMGGQSFGIKQTSPASYELSLAGTGTIVRNDNVGCSISTTSRITFNGANYNQVSTFPLQCLGNGILAAFGATGSPYYVQTYSPPSSGSANITSGFWDGTCTSCAGLKISDSNYDYMAISGTITKQSYGYTFNVLVRQSTGFAGQYTGPSIVASGTIYTNC